MRDELVAYLDSINSHLVEYLDVDQDLSSAVLRHVQRYARAMSQRLLLPEQVHEDWPDFYPLVNAFGLAHASSRLRQLARACNLFEGDGDEEITDADQVFLVTLGAEIQEVLSQRGAVER